jgi:hypothetical protein
MKLVNFTDSDGNQVWVNPDKVCRVLTRKEHCSVYTEDGGMVWLSIPADIAVDILSGKHIFFEEKAKKTAKKQS